MRADPPNLELAHLTPELAPEGFRFWDEICERVEENLENDSSLRA